MYYIMADKGPQRRARPPVAPLDVNTEVGRPKLTIKAPGAPQKRHPVVTRLTMDEYNHMLEHERRKAHEKAYDDAYGSALPVDLDAMPPVPIGDTHDEEYGKLHVGVAGVLGGGRRRRKHKSTTRTHKRRHKSTTRRHKRKHKSTTGKHKRKHKSTTRRRKR